VVYALSVPIILFAVVVEARSGLAWFIACPGKCCCACAVSTANLKVTPATPTTTNHGDDSDGYGPGEGYYPDGGYGYAGDLADADAWEHAAELSRN
jgi:hypothetical protein